MLPYKLKHPTGNGSRESSSPFHTTISGIYFTCILFCMFPQPPIALCKLFLSPNSPILFVSRRLRLPFIAASSFGHLRQTPPQPDASKDLEDEPDCGLGAEESLGAPQGGLGGHARPSHPVGDLHPQRLLHSRATVPGIATDGPSGLGCPVGSVGPGGPGFFSYSVGSLRILALSDLLSLPSRGLLRSWPGEEEHLLPAIHSDSRARSALHGYFHPCAMPESYCLFTGSRADPQVTRNGDEHKISELPSFSDRVPSPGSAIELDPALHLAQSRLDLGDLSSRICHSKDSIHPAYYCVVPSKLRPHCRPKPRLTSRILRNPSRLT